MPKNFSGKNLQGHSFQGQDLTDANFSHADIRGANFTDAILKGANFSHAKAGLQRRWAIILVAIALFISVLSGLFLGFASFFVTIFFTSEKINQYAIGIFVLIVLAIFFINTFRQGLLAAAETVAVAAAVAGVATVGMAVAAKVSAVASLLGAAAAAALLGAVGAVAVAVAIAAAVSPIASVAAVAAVVITAVVVLGLKAWAAVVVWTVTVLGIYIAWRALVGDEKYAFIRIIAINFAAIGGTSFYGADLTHANFVKATLKSTDFREAILTRSCWSHAKKIDCARVGNSILAEPSLRDLLVSGNGYKKSYVGANLRGVNLNGANLTRANLKEADLSEATLQGANLQYANLTKVQAVGTDFSYAYLTGACLEAWHIESTTELDWVDCQFVYFLEQPKPETDDRERRPSSGEFKPGEFSKLFQQGLNTVDLIFQQGIDWRAFIQSFDKVRSRFFEVENTEIAVQSIENKGEGVFVVRVSIPVDADKEKIHRRLRKKYERTLKAQEENYRFRFRAKNTEIQTYRQQSANMQEIIGLLASKSIKGNDTPT